MTTTTAMQPLRRSRRLPRRFSLFLALLVAGVTPLIVRAAPGGPPTERTQQTGASVKPAPAAMVGKTTIAELDEASDGYVLPLVYDPPRYPLPLVFVRINGSEPLPFLVDTGWGTNFTVADWVGEKLKLAPTGGTVRANKTVLFREVSVSSVTLCGVATEKGGKGDVDIAEMRTVDQGDFSLIESVCGPVTGLDGKPARLAGALGIGVLSATTARFDWAQKTLTVFVKPHPPLAPRVTRSVLSLRPGSAATDPDRFYVTLPPVAPQVPPVSLLLDTGSMGTSLPLAVTSRLSPRAAKMSGLGTIDSLFIVDRMLVPQLAIGSNAEPNVTVDALPPGDIGKMGMNLLARFRVTMDFRNNELILERAANWRDRVTIDGGTGIELARGGTDASGFVAQAVITGTIADRAGVRVNDRLVSVDGKPIADLPQSVVENLVEGVAATVAVLVWERPAALPGGKPETVTTMFTRPDEFSVSPRPYFGVSLQKPNNKPLIALRVLEGFAAYRAGLRDNDRIITLGGLPTDAMPPQTLRAQLLNYSIPITYRHTTDKPNVLRAAVLRADRPKTGP